MANAKAHYGKGCRGMFYAWQPVKKVTKNLWETT